MSNQTDIPGAAIPSGSRAIARVAVDLSLDREFDYLIPPALANDVKLGGQVIIPFGRSERRGWVTGFRDHSERADLKAILRPAGGKPLLENRILELARWLADYYCAPLETALRAALPAAVRRRGARFAEQATVAVTASGRAPEAASALNRAPKQAAALAASIQAGDGALLAALATETGLGDAPFRTLAKRGFLTLDKGRRLRDPHAGETLLRTEPLALMPQQADALALVRQALDTRQPPVLLLHGVTGSGKTEIYLQAIAHVLARGESAIVLVPEIALTPQTTERFRGRFGEQVAVLHSHLSDGERHDEWHRIRDGLARIVVGARSALFAPAPRLGLIVVDEEHEPTYKQDETPRYHARDMAVLRGHMEKCVVLLGSATPSLESWRNARLGRYALVRMPHRVDHREMPEMRIVDMRVETEREGKAHLFSRELVTAMQDRLARAEQTILFLNRRGYATAVLCPTCGHKAACRDCSVSLTWHKRRNELICHICGRREPPPAVCPACRDPAIRYAGVGTERMEETLAKFFPKARIARMDSDSMTARHAYRRVLGDFRVGKIDILVGTQMIAKGLDFPNVTLVGVVYADQSLHLPDFRAGERTFQLLTQVAGRAGRGDLGGEVIVQTYTPFHPAIQAARRLDFATFADQELAFREEAGYPPFTHLTCLTARGPEEAATRGALERFRAALLPRLPAGVVCSEAAPAPLERAQGLFRFQLMLRAASARGITRPLRATLCEFMWPRDVRAVVDVDAQHLL